MRATISNSIGIEKLKLIEVKDKILVNEDSKDIGEMKNALNVEIKFLGYRNSNKDRKRL